MDDNLPNQNQPDDSKLKELEKELQQLEKRAQGELNQQQEPQKSVSQEPGELVPPTPTQETPPQTKVSSMPPQTAQVKPSKTGGSGGKKGAKSILWISLVILLLSLVGAAGYYLGTSKAPTPTPTTQPTPTASPEGTTTAEWEIYESDTGWSMRYPEDVEVTENRAVSFMMFGPTQKEGTEFYDGISLTVRSGALGGLTLKEYVEDKVAEIENDAVSQVVSGPTPVTLSTYSGYRLTTTGLGTFDYYYLPLGETGYLEIIDATIDPEKAGFEETVKMMLNSIVISDVLLSPSPSPTVTATPSATP